MGPLSRHRPLPFATAQKVQKSPLPVHRWPVLGAFRSGNAGPRGQRVTWVSAIDTDSSGLSRGGLVVGMKNSHCFPRVQLCDFPGKFHAGSWQASKCLADIGRSSVCASFCPCSSSLPTPTVHQIGPIILPTGDCGASSKPEQSGIAVTAPFYD